MVCPNCHSSELIVIQGQNFCISCGRIVPAGHTPERAAKTKTAKRPVGRPKAGKLDVPKPVTVAELVTARVGATAAAGGGSQTGTQIHRHTSPVLTA